MNETTEKMIHLAESATQNSFYHTNRMWVSLGNAFRYDDEYLDGYVPKDRSDFVSIVADIIATGYLNWVLSGWDLPDGMQWVYEIDMKQVDWAAVAESIFDIDALWAKTRPMKQVILVGRHTSGVDYAEHGFNIVEQRNINWETDSDEAVIAQWDELCSEAWDKKLSILLQNIPAPLAIALAQNQWDVSVYVTIQVMGDRPADVKKSFRMTAYDIPEAIEACKHANGRARFEWDEQSSDFTVIVDPITPFKLQRIAQLF